MSSVRNVTWWTPSTSFTALFYTIDLTATDTTVATACRAFDEAEQQPDGKLKTQLEPGLKLFASPGVHTDLASPSALAAADEQRSRR
jgi:hypothetical protein